MAGEAVDRLTSEALENFGNKEAYDNLSRLDGIIRVFGQNNGIKVAGAREYEIVEGGAGNFVERTMYSQNTNVAHRSKGDSVATADDEGFTLIKSPQKLIDGAIVYNQVERDQVAGNWAIAPGLVEEKIDQFNTTWIQVIADAIRQATPGALDPLTFLPSATTGTVNGILIARTPAQQATDAALTCGLSRGLYSWWRNQYSNTSYDLTATAGRRGLYLDVFFACSRGTQGSMWRPNVGVAAGVVMASLGATIDSAKRATFEQDGKFLYGQNQVDFYGAQIVEDSSSRFLNGSAGKIAFFNTNAIKIKVLKGQGNSMKGMIKSNNELGSLPVFWKEGGMGSFVNDPTSLKWLKLGYLVYNIVPKSLQDHGLADNCT